MHSTQASKETDDPHDAPAIAPDVVPAAWADKVLADINRAAKSQPIGHAPDQLPRTPSTAVAAPAPAVDATFRAAAVGDIKPVAARPPKGKWVARVTMVFTFALVSAFAVGLWKHYGGEARQLIAEWTPPAVAEWAPQFALASSSEQAAPAEQAAAIDQAAPQTASAVQPTNTAAPAAAVPPESAEPIQTMARELADMGQQIEQLRASIAELKASQRPGTPAITRTTEAKPAEIRPPAPAPVSRPKMSAAAPLPPSTLRPVAPPPVRRPPPVQASAAPTQLTAPPPPPPYAPPQATARPDDEPVVRPPMPLRSGTVSD